MFSNNNAPKFNNAAEDARKIRKIHEKKQSFELPDFQENLAAFKNSLSDLFAKTKQEYYPILEQKSAEAISKLRAKGAPSSKVFNSLSKKVNWKGLVLSAGLSLSTLMPNNAVMAQQQNTNNLQEGTRITEVSPEVEPGNTLFTALPSLRNGIMQAPSIPDGVRASLESQIIEKDSNWLTEESKANWASSVSEGLNEALADQGLKPDQIADLIVTPKLKTLFENASQEHFGDKAIEMRTLQSIALDQAVNRQDSDLDEVGRLADVIPSFAEAARNTKFDKNQNGQLLFNTIFEANKQNIKPTKGDVSGSHINEKTVRDASTEITKTILAELKANNKKIDQIEELNIYPLQEKFADIYKQLYGDKAQDMIKYQNKAFELEKHARIYTQELKQEGRDKGAKKGFNWWPIVGGLGLLAALGVGGAVVMDRKNKQNRADSAESAANNANKYSIPASYVESIDSPIQRANIEEAVSNLVNVKKYTSDTEVLNKFVEHTTRSILNGNTPREPGEGSDGVNYLDNDWIEAQIIGFITMHSQQRNNIIRNFFDDADLSETLQPIQENEIKDLLYHTQDLEGENLDKRFVAPGSETINLSFMADQLEEEVRGYKSEVSRLTQEIVSKLEEMLGEEDFNVIVHNTERKLKSFSINDLREYLNPDNSVNEEFALSIIEALQPAIDEARQKRENQNQDEEMTGLLDEVQQILSNEWGISDELIQEVVRNQSTSLISYVNSEKKGGRKVDYNSLTKRVEKQWLGLLIIKQIENQPDKREYLVTQLEKYVEEANQPEEARNVVNYIKDGDFNPQNIRLITERAKDAGFIDQQKLFGNDTNLPQNQVDESANPTVIEDPDEGQESILDTYDKEEINPLLDEAEGNIIRVYGFNENIVNQLKDEVLERVLDDESVKNFLRDQYTGSDENKATMKNVFEDMYFAKLLELSIGYGGDFNPEKAANIKEKLTQAVHNNNNSAPLDLQKVANLTENRSYYNPLGMSIILIQALKKGDISVAEIEATI